MIYMDSHRYAVGSHEKPMDSHGFPWIPHAFLWISYGHPMDSYGFLCIPVGSCGYPMVSHGFRWIPMASYGFLKRLGPHKKLPQGGAGAMTSGKLLFGAVAARHGLEFDFIRFLTF